jgi:tetratricopeptide (TPR) repeat protein
VLFLLRRYVPDPWIWLRTAGRIRSLRAQIDANPANATARRDLARIHLRRLRPRAAIRLLDEALKRHPDDAELLYLSGLARARAGDADGALDPLVRAVERDPAVGYGEPYLVAGDALVQLRRVAEAEDAYERYVDSNTSSVRGHLSLARVRKRLGDTAGAKRALRDALTTFPQLPRFRRRQELSWYVRAQVTRLFL